MEGKKNNQHFRVSSNILIGLAYMDTVTQEQSVKAIK